MGDTVFIGGQAAVHAGRAGKSIAFTPPMPWLATMNKISLPDFDEK